MTTRSPEQAVLGLWHTLSARSWDQIGDWVSDDCIYVDMPVGPTLAAKGSVDIVRRLQVGLLELAAYENHDGTLVSDGENVMYEHSETWTFTSGEVVVLPFVTVHKVRDGKVTLWKDYWDFAAVATNAPADWMEKLAGADTSWVYDATGEI